MYPNSVMLPPYAPHEERGDPRTNRLLAISKALAARNGTDELWTSSQLGLGLGPLEEAPHELDASFVVMSCPGVLQNMFSLQQFQKPLRRPPQQPLQGSSEAETVPLGRQVKAVVSQKPPSRQRSKASNTGQAERQRRQLKALAAELAAKQQQLQEVHLDNSYLKQKAWMLDRFMDVHKTQPNWFRVRQAEAARRWQRMKSSQSALLTHMRGPMGAGQSVAMPVSRKAMLEKNLQDTIAKWRETVPQMAHCLQQLDLQPSHPLFTSEITRLTMEIFASCNAIVTEPDIWFRFLTTNTETGHQGVPQRSLWEQVVQAMRVSDQQRCKAYFARDIYLGQMQQIMSERQELLKQVGVGSGATPARGSHTGLDSCLPGGIAAQLGDNLMQQHHVSLVFVTVATTELMDTMQQALCYVRSYPWVPDMLAIVDVMADGLQGGISEVVSAMDGGLESNCDERVRLIWNHMRNPISHDQHYTPLDMLQEPFKIEQF